MHCMFEFEFDRDFFKLLQVSKIRKKQNFSN